MSTKTRDFSDTYLISSLRNNAKDDVSVVKYYGLCMGAGWKVVGWEERTEEGREVAGGAFFVEVDGREDGVTAFFSRASRATLWKIG